MSRGCSLGTGSSPKFRTYRQIPTLRPYYYRVTQLNLLNLRYISLELLNFAHIFLVYFLKFVTLNKCRCKTLSFGAIANFSRFFCPPQEAPTSMSRKAKIYVNSDIIVSASPRELERWDYSKNRAMPNDVRGNYVVLSSNVSSSDREVTVW